MYLKAINEQAKCSSADYENGLAIPVFSRNLRNYIRETKFKKFHKSRRKELCFLCKSQANSIALVIGAYVTIFMVASTILTVSVLRLQNFNGKDKNISYFSTGSENIYSSKYSVESVKSNKLISKKLFKQFKWPFKSSIFNCSNLGSVKKFKYLKSGWTKNVFSFQYMGKSYALKSVNINGLDIQNCLVKRSMKTCLEKASSKMYKEYILSRELFHTNIVKVLAWCVSGNYFANEVTIVTELCTPLDIVLLLRMSFSQRLKIMVDLSELMLYLAYSPLGSVAINDFQLQQFVLCGNTLKLTDLDDLSIEEPKCNKSTQCVEEKLFPYTNSIIKLNCIDNFCLGYNEKQNVINSYKHFVSLFLNIRAPVALKKSIENLLGTYTSTWDAKSVFQATEQLYIKYKNLNSTRLRDYY